MSRLVPQDVTLAYDGDPVVRGLTHSIADGRITGIVGPNACGKSTLLRALARLMRPVSGSVVLDGEAIHTMPTREVARRLGLLPQHTEAPEAISVVDLVRRGRYPHQGFLDVLRHEDELAVDRALARAGMNGLRDRLVDELSGGQRQRAWIAMVLAQETDLMLLDEPTTYLDLAHRLGVLSLLHRLNEEEGRTIVVVLHDVNEAADVCDELIAMRDGAIADSGSVGAVLTPDLLESVFGVECDLVARGGGRFFVGRSRWFAGSATSPNVPTAPGSVGEPGPRIAAAEQPGGVGETTDRSESPVIRATGLAAGYPDRPVLQAVSLDIPGRAVTAIVGPNACGKSTLLRALARLLPARGGDVALAVATQQPVNVCALAPRSLARSISLLEQGTKAPPDTTVEDLVAVGRFPYQRWFAQWSRADRHAVERSMELVGVVHLRNRPVGTLSGGQRRRVALAMALAQQTPVMMLDEPTTFLDIAHQADVLDLALAMNRHEGRTVIMVLHDLWQAMRYADHIVVMNEGEIVTTGSPADIAASPLVERVFGVALHQVRDPQTGRPLLVPGGVRDAVVA